MTEDDASKNGARLRAAAEQTWSALEPYRPRDIDRFFRELINRDGLPIPIRLILKAAYPEWGARTADRMTMDAVRELLATLGEGDGPTTERSPRNEEP